MGILVMFYAPCKKLWFDWLNEWKKFWNYFLKGCGYCKKLKPEYSEAATKLKSSAVLAAMNVDDNVKVI